MKETKTMIAFRQDGWVPNLLDYISVGALLNSVRGQNYKMSCRLLMHTVVCFEYLQSVATVHIGVHYYSYYSDDQVSYSVNDQYV